MKQALAAGPFAGPWQHTLPAGTALLWCPVSVRHTFRAGVPQPLRALSVLVLRGDQKEVLAKDLHLGVRAWDL